ncbi:hypothetical protein D3C85_1528170 [compost metagenome]
MAGILGFKTTLPPGQNVVGPSAVIIGTAGLGITVTIADPDPETGIVAPVLSTIETIV